MVQFHRLFLHRGSGNGHDRPQQHRREVSAAVLGFYHRAFRSILVADDDDPIYGAEVQIP